MNKIRIGLFIIFIFLYTASSYGLDYLYIENFENADVVNQFDTYEDSDSSVDLSASYKTFNQDESKIALKIDYQLETENSWGSFIEISKEFIPYKNLSLFDYISVRIKGNGNRDVLEIIFKDSSGKSMKYVNDSVIGNINWQDLKINLDKFTKEKSFNIAEVKGIIIKIKSISADTSSGVIYIDDIIGHLKIIQAGSQAAVKTALLNWNVKGKLEYRDEPGSADKLWHRYDLILRGGYKNIGIDSTISIRSLKYNYKNSETEKDFSANDGLTSDDIIPHEVKATKILFFVVNPIPYIDLIEIGNLRINYNPYTIYKTYGYEGINVFFSRIYKIQLNAFYFKEWNDGYTAGSRLLYADKLWRFNFLTDIAGILQNKKALLYQDSFEVVGKTVFKESSYTAEERIRFNANGFIRKFIARFIDLRLLYGKYSVNEYTDITQLTKDADGVYLYSDTYNAPYNHYAEIKKGELRFKYIALPASSVNLYYYNIGLFSFVRPGGNSDNVFVPTFMQEGISDDYKGFEAEFISKYIPSIILSGSYGKFSRVSSSEYWDKYSVGVGKAISLIALSFKYTVKNYYDRLIESSLYDVKDLYFSFKAKARIGRKVVIQSTIKSRVDKYYKDNVYRWQERGMMFSNLIQYKFNNRSRLQFETVRTLPDNYFSGVTLDNLTRLMFTFEF